MSASTFIGHLFDRIERRPLAVHEFTCLLPLSEHVPKDHGLHARLRELDERVTPNEHEQLPESAFSRASGLHSARILLFGNTERTKDRQANRSSASHDGLSAEGPLLLNLIYDGSLDDLLRQLLQDGDDLMNVLASCRGFPGAAQPDGLWDHARRILRKPEAEDADAKIARVIAWLKKARLTGGYFFSDIDDQSREEIDESAARWRAFLEFYEKHQGEGDSARLRRAFRAFWQEQDEVSIPRPCKIEPRPKRDEARWIRRVAHLTARAQQRDNRARHRRKEAPLRQVHVKPHASLDATFTVRADIPPSLRHGIFAESRSYKALIRLSNGANVAQPDRTPDGRGMSIRLFGVPGENLLRSVLQQPTENRHVQDFLLLSHPNFFAADAEDFAKLFGAISAPSSGWSALLVRFARRPRALRVLLETYLRRVAHPLDVTYHSGTPYLLGDPGDEGALAVKYSVRPKLGKRKSLARARVDRTHPNFLSKALAETLDPRYGETVALEFCLNVPRGDRRPAIDDAIAAWPDVEVVPVATITISPQSFSRPLDGKQLDELAFNPWHALRAHQPLGSLNRARLVTYLRSASERGAAVGAVREAEPQGFGTIWPQTPRGEAE